MSGIIQLLPDHIANQIAAGEVIQRPASVVKELMENAIDAGSSKIQVVIKDAGKTMIQVTDNGTGMIPEDALKCFDRHATSKIQSADDLYALTTKGFRGEALASIAAIAHVTLRTRHLNADIGQEIEMEGSQIRRNEPCVAPIGTTFEIKNLFFNVPARRNFLKSDAIEWNHIVDEFERVALAHPDIHFALTHNNQEVHELPSQVLRKRIVDVIGKSSNDKLVPIEEETAIVSVHGFVGKPEAARKTRGQQFLFVNNRFFKDSYFNHAIVRAFEGLLPAKYHPSYFLYFTVDPKRIDVNVHPTKTEIKFEEDRSIYAILVSSIRQALGKYNIAPTLDFEQETGFDLPHSFKNLPATEPVISVDPDFNPFRSYGAKGTVSNREKSFTPAIQAEGFGKKQPESADWQSFYQVKEEEENQTVLLSNEPDLDLNLSGVLLLDSPFFAGYVNNELLIVHSIRAYLRVTYDQLMHHFLHSPVASQALLFPFERACSAAEKEEWLVNEVLLNRLGFVTHFDENNIVISAVPSLLHAESIHECIEQIFDKITFTKVEKSDVAHHVVLELSRSESKQKGKVSSQIEAEELLTALLTTKEPGLTPDGKTILSNISFTDLTRFF